MATRATIMVRVENTTDKEALLIKELVAKALEKTPNVFIELHIMSA